MIIAGAKSSIALGTFPLPRFVTGSKAVVTKTVEAFGQDCVLSFYFARGAGQGLLVLPDFLLEDLVHVGGHLDLA